MNSTAPKKLLRKTTLIALGTIGLMGLGISTASAHVTVDASSTAENSYSLLSFSIPHGCDGSATTKIAISLPENINDATPTVNPNWTVSKLTEKLAQPKTLENGSKISERTSQVIYTAKVPLSAELRDALVLSLKLPEGVGSQLNFPVLQSCVKGQTNWSNLVKAGQDHDAVQDPAPSITLTAASSGEHGETAAAHTPAADQQSSPLPGWIGLGAGLLALVLSGVALFLVRKTRS
ncbi:YcnI family protein [Psychromicrobium sp. YIM B11713]|uniref:YcnI family copper-binding membrane protein n=1 Tax=Psychromicrobium sp. YIM B11713 TaxID=3145233 RepID=UPI00374E742F